MMFRVPLHRSPALHGVSTNWRYSAFHFPWRLNVTIWRFKVAFDVAFETRRLYFNSRGLMSWRLKLDRVCKHQHSKRQYLKRH